MWWKKTSVPKKNWSPLTSSQHVKMNVFRETTFVLLLSRIWKILHFTRNDEEPDHDGSDPENLQNHKNHRKPTISNHKNPPKTNHKPIINSSQEPHHLFPNQAGLPPESTTRPGLCGPRATQREAGASQGNHGRATDSAVHSWWTYDAVIWLMNGYEYSNYLWIWFLYSLSIISILWIVIHIQSWMILKLFM